MEVLGKWHEVDSIQNHAPYAYLHDSFAAEEECRRGAGCATENQAAFVVVEVDGKAGASRPAVEDLQEHGVLTEVIKPIVGIRKEEYFGW